MTAKSQFFSGFADADTALQQHGCVLDLQLQKVFVNTDTGIFLTDSLETGFTDAAVGGDIGYTSSAADMVVHILYRLFEDLCFRRIGLFSLVGGFRKRQEQLAEIGDQHLGIGFRFVGQRQAL